MKPSAETKRRGMSERHWVSLLIPDRLDCVDGAVCDEKDQERKEEN